MSEHMYRVTDRGIIVHSTTNCPHGAGATSRIPVEPTEVGRFIRCPWCLQQSRFLHCEDARNRGTA